MVLRRRKPVKALGMTSARTFGTWWLGSRLIRSCSWQIDCYCKVLKAAPSSPIPETKKMPKKKAETVVDIDALEDLFEPEAGCDHHLSKLCLLQHPLTQYFSFTLYFVQAPRGFNDVANSLNPPTPEDGPSGWQSFTHAFRG